jgi:hypothetical protein
MNFRDVLLTNENIIKSTSNIFENVSGNYLLPSIKLAQDIDLEYTIGTRLKQELQKMVFNNNFKNIYKTLLDDFVQPFLTYSTIVRLIPTVAYKIGNAGVLRTDDEKMINLSSNEVDKVRNEYQRIADTYKNRLQRFLLEHKNEFPELQGNNTVENIQQNLYSSATNGLALGGARGKKIN